MRSWICGFALLFTTHCAWAAETIFLLVRHGETNLNLTGSYGGWTDCPLNEKGLSQADDLSAKLLQDHPDIAAIYSSDLARAYSTALPTAEAFQLPIQKRVALREIFWGLGEGITPEERKVLYGDTIETLVKNYPHRKDRWDQTVFPGAETYNHLLHRTCKELDQIAKQHPGQTVAIFTHGRLLKTLLAELLDNEDCPYPSNCGTVLICYDSETPEQPLSFLRIENLQ